MLIKIVSDLHMNFLHGRSPKLQLEWDEHQIPDVLIVAGDIAEAGDFIDGVRHLANTYPQVVLVPGNHDFYRGSLDGTLEMVKEVNKEFPNVHALQCEVVKINGQRFVGCTMWFKDTPTTRMHTFRMNDFRLIKDFKAQVWDEHKRHIKFLHDNIQKGDIVITHHAPSTMSHHPYYANDVLNDYYVVDMSKLMLDKLPKFWFHGHTHTNFDYIIGDTRVMCNPYGYYGYDPNPEFKPELLIDTEKEHNNDEEGD